MRYNGFIEYTWVIIFIRRSEMILTQKYKIYVFLGKKENDFQNDKFCSYKVTKWKFSLSLSLSLSLSPSWQGLEYSPSWPGTCYVAQVGLKLAILLPQCGNTGMPPCLPLPLLSLLHKNTGPWLCFYRTWSETAFIHLPNRKAVLDFWTSHNSTSYLKHWICTFLF
jgi:hypothetical protein